MSLQFDVFLHRTLHLSFSWRSRLFTNVTIGKKKSLHLDWERSGGLSPYKQSFQCSKQTMNCLFKDCQVGRDGKAQQSSVQKIESALCCVHKEPLKLLNIMKMEGVCSRLDLLILKSRF